MRLLLAARLSRLQKNGEQGLGIETQDQRGKEWAERTTDPVTGKPHVVVGTAADTKSGTVAPWDRPKLRPWVTDPELMAQYDGILAYKNDRLSRGCWSDEARIRLWAQDHGKHLVIVDGPQWPPRHEGDQWAWEAMAIQARKEWEQVQERTIRALTELKSQGKNTNRAPFGYISIGEKYDHSIVPTDLGRAYIPEIFSRVIAGDSLGDIAKWLISEGVPTQQGGTWAARTIGGIIRNPAYSGFGCERTKGQHYGKVIFRCEKLVDENVWKAANDALATRPQRRHGGIVPENRAMLAGAITCPSCEGAMYRMQSRTRRNGRQVKIAYYRCPERKGVKCSNMVRCDRADAAVSATIAESFGIPVMERRVKLGTDHEAELEAVKFELRHLADRELPDEEHDQEQARLRAERDRIAALPKTEDTIELVATGDTYAGLWGPLSVPERGPWLTEHGFRVFADKAEVTVRQGDRWARRKLPLST